MIITSYLPLTDFTFQHLSSHLLWGVLQQGIMHTNGYGEQRRNIHFDLKQQESDTCSNLKLQISSVYTECYL